MRWDQGEQQGGWGGARVQQRPMGWRGHPAVVKVAGWLAGSNAMPGVGAVEWACSVGKCGRGAGGARKEAGWVMGMVWQREGSSWEGLGRSWVVVGSVGSYG